MQQNYYPPGGTDYLELWTDGDFEVGGRVETLEGTGRFVVQRSFPEVENPTNIVTEIVTMNVRGHSETFGDYLITLNPLLPTMGEKPVMDLADQRPGSRFSGYFDVFFEMRLLDHGTTLFNREPVRIQAVVGSLPPIGASGETAPNTRVALYDSAKPDGDAVAFLLSTRKVVGQYVNSDYASRSRELGAARIQADHLVRTGKTKPAELVS